MSSTRTLSENEFARLGETRQRLDRGVEEDVFRNGAALGDEDLGTGGIAVTFNGDQTATIAQLAEKGSWNLFDCAVDEDQIIGSAGSVTLFQRAGHHLDLGVAGKLRLRFSGQRFVAFERDDGAGNDRQERRGVAAPSPSAMGVRMQTFMIQSRQEALHYNADARLLLIKYSSGEIRSFTRISPQGMRRLLGSGPDLNEGPELSDLQYQAQIRKGGLKAVYRLTGINPLQFDFSPDQGIW